jgi:3-hydroxybutyryl-CoA dehydrogenase
MTQPTYTVRSGGISRSFPQSHALLEGAAANGSVLLLVGDKAALQSSDPDFAAIAIEVGDEGLGVHTGEDSGREGSNVVGFSRWRLGSDDPSNLIELVVQPQTSADAVALVRAVFEGAGFQVSACADRPGRIVDRLLRPQFNLALQAVDDGLVNAKDLDTCIQLGLGYRKGFIAPLERSGLEHHHDVSLALYRVYGRPEYVPARQAVVAKMRAVAGEGGRARKGRSESGA